MKYRFIVIVLIGFILISCQIPSDGVTQWTNLPFYTITFHANNLGASGDVPDPQKKIQGIDLYITVSTGSLQKSGYLVTGWNEKQDGTGTHYSPGGLFIDDENTILYAVWTPTHTVQFVTNGDISVDDVTVLEGETLTLPETPHRSDYIFLGWYSDPTFETTWIEDTPVLKDTILYGKWGMEVGQLMSFTVNGIDFGMVNVDYSGSFPINTSDTLTASIPNAYWIGETEVTYDLWIDVFLWARNNGYTFDGYARQGSGTTSGMSPSHPVTDITIREAMIWCNALTEYWNELYGTVLSPVYCIDNGFTIPLRVVDGSITSWWKALLGTQDVPFMNKDSDGFRLPTNEEWELASRWRIDAINTVTGYSSPWFTKGNSASGATTYTTDRSLGSGQPALGDCLSLAVFESYRLSDSNEVTYYTGVKGTAEVKSKNPNHLGLYDMSGNVAEYTYFPIEQSITCRIRGGSWPNPINQLMIGQGNTTQTHQESYNIGFRIAKTNFE